MKKLSFAISCLLLSNLVAGSDGQEIAKRLPAKTDECRPVCPEIPPSPVASLCRPKTYSCCGVVFDLYGELLFLQPNGSNLYYAVEAIPFNPAIATPVASPDWRVFEISPHYAPGFQVGAKFLFPNSDMSLETKWERLYTQKDASYKVSLATDMIGPIFDIGPNSAAYQIAKGKGTFHFDSANLTFGKMVCFFNSLYTQFYAGANFARIKQTIYSHFANLSGTFARSIKAPSLFTGAGPQFGANFYYLLGKNFYFTGNSSISLLMGQLKNHTTFRSFSPEIALIGNPQPNVQNTSVPNRSQLIPGFEEKLGFSYTLQYNRCKLIFATGYQFQIYLNAVQSVDMISQVLPALETVTPDVGLFAVAFQRTLSNFILSGPYLTFFVDF